MRQTFIRVAFAAVPFLHLAAVRAADDAPVTAAPKAFAAPGAASSLPSSTAGGIGQATLALLLVLAAIFAIAWLARRMRGAVRAGGQGIDVIAQATVGPRERVVIVRVGTTRLLLGVAPGRVSALHELPADVTIDAGTGTGTTMGTPKFPTFIDSLRAVMKGRVK
jgi:flagellar protein FliO/FliZ